MGNGGSRGKCISGRLSLHDLQRVWERHSAEESISKSDAISFLLTLVGREVDTNDIEKIYSGISKEELLTYREFVQFVLSCVKHCEDGSIPLHHDLQFYFILHWCLFLCSIMAYATE
eukprot:TRINITY_DN4769_c0_g1_i2.p1 TRINITY_DN4769_c0_g1~~TRINITY_DN4769_c0_g1_i2.p1  ORF type:complete len:117 (+),score=8.07 TRINITY_DN4769_c0_g1_i2:93-443(+)